MSQFFHILVCVLYVFYEAARPILLGEGGLFFVSLYQKKFQLTLVKNLTNIYRFCPKIDYLMLNIKLYVFVFFCLPGSVLIFLYHF